MASSDEYSECTWGQTCPSPDWKQEEADLLLGKYLLVGLSRYKGNWGGDPSYEQVHGRISRINGLNGIELVCEGAGVGRTVVLPPVLEAIKPADPGIYSLKSTGEDVIDPDFTAQFDVKSPNVE